MVDACLKTEIFPDIMHVYTVRDFQNPCEWDLNDF